MVWKMCVESAHHIEQKVLLVVIDVYENDPARQA